MNERILVVNRALHARPASSLAKLASGFASDIQLLVAGRTANAKSVLSLLALDLDVGDEVAVRADGGDAGAAVDAVSAMLSAVEAHDD
jgi:phosphotransferase system HPr (HPr) family protein